MSNMVHNHVVSRHLSFFAKYSKVQNNFINSPKIQFSSQLDDLYTGELVATSVVDWRRPMTLLVISSKVISIICNCPLGGAADHFTYLPMRHPLSILIFLTVLCLLCLRQI